MQINLSGKQAIITGASQGLGLEIARKLIAAGADVMLCARNERSLESAHVELIKGTSARQKIISEVGDVSSEADVCKIVSKTFEILGGCQILVNNAGIYGPKGYIESIDWMDWMKTIEINVYGSVLMTRKLLPHFKKQKYGKIIQLSGGGATKPMPRVSAYAVSKAAIVRFAETVSEEVRGLGIDVNCLAPGPLNTRMLDEILEAGSDKIGLPLYNSLVEQKRNGGAPLSKAGDLALFLASNASDGISGKLISALWDKWEDWPNHLKELLDSDIYTLRRIIGKDRGYFWGDK